jgi:hypothetical protein
MWCDVALDVREEFDHWHAHEHMPERLGIPGFLRGSRWVAEQGTGYFILYEVQSETVLTSAAYLERLNNPTPWSRRMMPHHRNMVRGLCRIDASYGAGLGEAMLAVRFSADEAMRAWLTGVLASLPARKGVTASMLLRNIAQPAPATAEQQLRGGDCPPDWVVLINGYSADALALEELSDAHLRAQGGRGECVAGRYRLAYMLAASGYTERPEEAS